MSFDSTIGPCLQRYKSYRASSATEHLAQVAAPRDQEISKHLHTLQQKTAACVNVVSRQLDKPMLPELALYITSELEASLNELAASIRKGRRHTNERTLLPEESKIKACLDSIERLKNHELNAIRTTHGGKKTRQLKTLLNSLGEVNAQNIVVNRWNAIQDQIRTLSHGVATSPEAHEEMATPPCGSRIFRKVKSYFTKTKRNDSSQSETPSQASSLARPTDSGEHLSGEHLSGEHLSGEHLSGKHLSGEHLSGEHLSGEHLSGEHLSGESLCEGMIACHEQGDPSKQVIADLCTQEYPENTTRQDETSPCKKHSPSLETIKEESESESESMPSTATQTPEYLWEEIPHVSEITEVPESENMPSTVTQTPEYLWEEIPHVPEITEVPESENMPKTVAQAPPHKDPFDTALSELDGKLYVLALAHSVEVLNASCTSDTTKRMANSLKSFIPLLQKKNLTGERLSNQQQKQLNDRLNDIENIKNPAIQAYTKPIVKRLKKLLPSTEDKDVAPKNWERFSHAATKLCTLRKEPASSAKRKTKIPATEPITPEQITKTVNDAVTEWRQSAAGSIHTSFPSRKNAGQDFKEHWALKNMPFMLKEDSDPSA